MADETPRLTVDNLKQNVSTRVHTLSREQLEWLNTYLTCGNKSVASTVDAFVRQIHTQGSYMHRGHHRLWMWLCPFIVHYGPNSQ